MTEYEENVLKASDVVILPPKNIDQSFLMILCLLTAVPIIFGKAPAPGSIEETLPPVMVLVWSIVLALGALIVLVSYVKKDRVSGIIYEQFGSICLAVAGTAYGLSIFKIAGDNGGAVAGALILGFALTRALTARQHQKTLKRVRTAIELLNKREGR